jgi:adenosine kinase
MFDPAHMKGPEIAPLVDGAHFFYVEGYFLTSGAAIALDLAKHASNANKVGALRSLYRTLIKEYVFGRRSR